MCDWSVKDKSEVEWLGDGKPKYFTLYHIDVLISNAVFERYKILARSI